ncbi:MAG: hypothetical protein Q3971_09090 [Moraxella sp.]|nr:hypothetical protein [Moraxella sp.]
MKTNKHHFEAVSLLTPKNGMLNISIIPAIGQPNWLVPTALILAVCDDDKQTQHYHWQHTKGVQEVPVYPLVPKDIPADKMIILEGNTDAHRLALHTVGQIQTLDVKISDVKDTELDDEEWAIIQNSLPYAKTPQDDKKNHVYQPVMINNETYIIPDLDEIADYLAQPDADGL